MLIEFESVSLRFNQTTVFENLDLRIESNGIHAIMGPSGIGKSTLLRLLTAQIRPDSGTVRLLGEDVYRMSRRRLLALRKKMGVLFQYGGLLSDLTVFDNVALPLQEHTNLDHSLIHCITLMKLEMVGLRGVKDALPQHLSGGMLRRVSLARALVMDPSIILYDEPFVGQDPISMGILMQVIKTIGNNMPTCSLLVSHDVAETLAICDHVYLLSDKRVIASGSPEQMLQHTSPSVQQFLKGKADGPVPFHKPTNMAYQDELLSTYNPS